MDVCTVAYKICANIHIFPTIPHFYSIYFQKSYQQSCLYWCNMLKCRILKLWNAGGGIPVANPEITIVSRHAYNDMCRCAFVCLVYSYALPSHPMLIMQPSCYLKAALSKECKEGKPVRKRLLTFCFGHEHLHFPHECFSVWKKITYFAAT